MVLLGKLVAIPLDQNRKGKVRKCDLVVLMSWSVENRCIFKEQVLKFFFRLIKLLFYETTVL